MSEMLDIFDSRMNRIGEADRDEVHKKGYWHQTFQGWIIFKRSGKAYVLVQKRDKNKKTAPDKLDITAAGHLIAGESPTDGVREVEEELGIKINPNDLINLGIRVAVSESENKINKEFAHVFLMEHNLPIDQYQINKEVSGLVEIEVQDGLRLFSGATNRIFCNSVWLENGKKVSKIIEVRQEDFIYRIDQYYLKVFIMTERFYEGKSILAI